MIQCPNCGEFEVRETRSVRVQPGMRETFRKRVHSLKNWLGDDGGTDLTEDRSRLPCFYRRRCHKCGHRWIWEFGQAQPRIRRRSSRLDKVDLNGQDGKTQLPPEFILRVLPESVIFMDAQLRSELRSVSMQRYQPWLDELVAFWKKSYRPDPGFYMNDEKAFFCRYQADLGEPLVLRPEAGYKPIAYYRNYMPEWEDIATFAKAYFFLRRGDLNSAAQVLSRLAQNVPQFAEAWLWLSAVSNDHSHRLSCLQHAVELEPAHPLAVAALALARGEVALDGGRQYSRRGALAVILRCAQCGGTLHYEPGETHVICEHCASQIILNAGAANGRAPLVSTLNLQRLYQGHTWQEVEQALHCQGCGANLVMENMLVKQCTYCGSPNLMLQQMGRKFERPDALIPFVLDQAQAAAAMQRALPAPLNQARVLALRGVYIPYWMFDGMGEECYRRVYDDGAQSIIYSNRANLEKVLLPAVSSPAISFLDRLPPFDLQKLVPFNPLLLADWSAQLYDQDVAQVVEDAYDLLLGLYRRKLGPAPDLGQPLNSSYAVMRTLQLSRTTYQLALLPVWGALLQAKSEAYLALVNGQTGEVVW